MAWIKKSSYKGIDADYWGKYFISYDTASNKTTFILYLFWNKTTAYDSPLVQLESIKFEYTGEKTKQECYALTSQDPFFEGAVNDESPGFTTSESSLDIKTGLTTLIIDSGMTYTSGQTAMIYYSNFKKMQGEVISYNYDSGELNVNVRKKWGTNIKKLSLWYVFLVETPSNSISVTSSLVGKINNTKKIKAINAYYEDDVTSDCTFLSNDLNIATVDTGGTVTMESTGSTTITTTYKDGISVGSTNVTVYYSGSYLKITPNPVSGTTGYTIPIISKTNFNKVVTKYTTWSQSPQSIYSMSDSGITINKVGNDQLIGTYYDMTGSTIVKGYNTVTSIDICGNDMNPITGITTGSTEFIISVINQDEIVITSECNYLSSDTNLATCQNGIITKINSGTCIITVTSQISPNISKDFEIIFE